MIPTSKELFEWARHHAQGHCHGQYPTVREASRHFKCSMKAIRRVVEEGTDLEEVLDDFTVYFGLGVAFGNRNGTFTLPAADQFIEAYSHRDHDYCKKCGARLGLECQTHGRSLRCARCTDCLQCLQLDDAAAKAVKTG